MSPKHTHTHTHWQGRHPRSPIWSLGRKPLNQDRKGTHVCVSQIGPLSPCVCLSAEVGVSGPPASLSVSRTQTGHLPPGFLPTSPGMVPHLPVPTLAAGRGNLLFGLKEGQEGPGSIHFSQFPLPSGPQFAKLKNGRMVSGGIQEPPLQAPLTPHRSDPANSDCFSGGFCRHNLRLRRISKGGNPGCSATW